MTNETIPEGVSAIFVVEGRVALRARRAHESVRLRLSRSEPGSGLVTRLSKEHVEELKRTWPTGCMPPKGYVQWADWAEAQHRHGLRQQRCTVCGLFRFPQQRPCDHKSHS